MDQKQLQQLKIASFLLELKFTDCRDCEFTSFCGNAHTSSCSLKHGHKSIKTWLTD